MYWEDRIPSETRPEYLELCLESIKRHCGSDFEVTLLNETTVYEVLPDLRRDLHLRCSIPQKADIIRLFLLQKYGGIWLDADSIVFRSLYPFYQMLGDVDFVGFGCYYADCSHRMDGNGKPANWAMISRASGKLVTLALERALFIVEHHPDWLRTNYHCLGKDLLWNSLRQLHLKDPHYRYRHISSRCLERDSRGDKLTNGMLLSSRDIDPTCQNRLTLIPIYNTAPGFPPWFLKQTAYELYYRKDLLISKLFRLSLPVFPSLLSFSG